MEKVEPTFVPEWLKSNGSAKMHQTTPSLAKADGRIASNSNNLSSTRVNGNNFGRSSVSDKTTSPYFCRSASSNGYSNSRFNGNYGRGNRDTEQNKEKVNGYSHPRREYSYSSGNRFEKDLRRSYTTINQKQGEPWSKKGSDDTINGYKSTNKSSFQRDFPSLGGEVRHVAPEIKRNYSSGLSTLIKGEKWSSALAEVPDLVQNGGVFGAPQQVSSNNGGPNVADTLTSSPRSNSSSLQLPTENQKVEEQAGKQSRQLVPMTSSVSKPLVHNASEKLKPKVGQQTQISSSLQSNHLNRNLLIKSDVSRASVPGKHFVIKPEKEGNSLFSTLLNPTIANRSSNPLATVEHKPTLVLERRPSAQAKSRNEFFKLMRKKSLETPQSSLSPSDLDNNGDASLLESFVGEGLVDKENEIEIKCESANFIEKRLNECGEECPRFKAFFYSEEREVAFLHSLGWEETEKEDEGGLTTEEINAFFKDLNEQIKSRPSSRSLQKMQLKYSKLLDNPTGSVSNGCVSSQSSLSEAKLES